MPVSIFSVELLPLNIAVAVSGSITVQNPIQTIGLSQLLLDSGNATSGLDGERIISRAAL
jgi:hypothetical protein